MARRTPTTLKEVGDTLAFIVERMTTKDDLAKFPTKDDVRDIVRVTIQQQVPGIVAIELKSIRTDLKQLSANVENVIGFRKEIDHALERIGAMERHLGINKKIAA